MTQELKDKMANDADSGDQTGAAGNGGDPEGDHIPSASEVARIAHDAATKVTAEATEKNQLAQAQAAYRGRVDTVMNGVIDADEGMKSAPDHKRAYIQSRGLAILREENAELNAGDEAAVMKLLPACMEKAIEEDRASGDKADKKNAEGKEDAEKRARALDGAAGTGGAGRSAGQGSEQATDGIAVEKLTFGPGGKEIWPTDEECAAETKREADKFLAAAKRE